LDIHVKNYSIVGMKGIAFLHIDIDKLCSARYQNKVQYENHSIYNDKGKRVQN